MKTAFFRILTVSVLCSACTVIPSPQQQEEAFAQPDIPQTEPENQQPIPYPRLNEQTQIDDLNQQVARLEREVATLNHRLHKAHRENTAARPAAPTGIRKLDDRTLTGKYLASGNAVSDNTDAANQHENRLYTLAVKHYRRGEYAAAAAVLREADGGNGSEAARRNMFLLMQIQQRIGNCESVIEIGGRYANRFRNSPQAPDALFSIGQCQYKLQQKDIARATWRKLIQSYPRSEAAARAAIRIKQR